MILKIQHKELEEEMKKEVAGDDEEDDEDFLAVDAEAMKHMKEKEDEVESRKTNRGASERIRKAEFHRKALIRHQKKWEEDEEDRMEFGSPLDTIIAIDDVGGSGRTKRYVEQQYIMRMFLARQCTNATPSKYTRQTSGMIPGTTRRRRLISTARVRPEARAPSREGAREEDEAAVAATMVAEEDEDEDGYRAAYDDIEEPVPAIEDGEMAVTSNYAFEA